MKSEILAGFNRYFFISLFFVIVLIMTHHYFPLDANYKIVAQAILVVAFAITFVSGLYKNESKKYFPAPEGIHGEMYWFFAFNADKKVIDVGTIMLRPRNN